MKVWSGQWWSKGGGGRVAEVVVVDFGHKDEEGGSCSDYGGGVRS